MRWSTRTLGQIRLGVVACGLLLGSVGGRAATMDILIVYTREVRQAHGGAAGVAAHVNTAVASANLALADSRIDGALRLVRLEEVDYVESDDGMVADLRAMWDPADGMMDEIAAWREESGADLVCLFQQSPTGSTGQGYALAVERGVAALAFTTVDTDYVAGGTFAHEIGHNLGSQHGRGDPRTAEPLFPYAWGYRFLGASGSQFRTLMAYSPGLRIMRYSNPEIEYDQVPLGKPEADAESADNARAFNITVPVVADYYATVVPSDDEEPPQEEPPVEVEPPIEVEPTISVQPMVSWSQVAWGGEFELTVEAVGSPAPQYQWRRNGLAISGETGSSLIIQKANENDSGSYDVVVSNAAGSVVSEAVQIAVAARVRRQLVNLSVRRNLAGNEPVIVGFVVAGSGQRRLLIRAVGGSLADYEVANAMPDPRLIVFGESGGVLLQNNDADGGTELAGAIGATGAFPLSSPRDAALVASLAPGVYTVQVQAADGIGGEVLTEIYDVTGQTDNASEPLSSSRPVNLSTRSRLQAGDTLIVGFVLESDSTRRLLVRAMGPTLTEFGVIGVMADPQWSIYDERGDLVGGVTDFVATAELDAATTSAGAFAAGSSEEAVAVRSFAPGAYTIHVTAEPGTAGGEVLVEMYDVTVE